MFLYARSRFCVWFFSLTVTAAVVASVAAASVPDSLRLLRLSTIIVDQTTNTGSAWLHLHNVSKAPVTVSLSAGDFISKTTGKELGAQITFTDRTDAAGKSIYLARVARDSILYVKVSASNLWEAGESEAVLYHRDSEIGRLKAVKYRVPFNLKLETQTPDAPSLSFERNRPTWMILKNDDAMTYPVHWELAMADTSLAGTVTLTPNGSVPIKLEPPAEWFETWLSGFVKEQPREAQLTLRFQPPGGAHEPGLPVKVTQVKASLGYYSAKTRDLTSTLIILLFLAAGGGCSLLLSYWIPNRLRLFELKDQLASLARKTRALSYRIDSSLRVLLRVERLRIFKLLDASQWGFSPELANLLTQSSQRIAALSKRVDLVAVIDGIYERLAALHGALPPPALLAQTEEKLQHACNLLKRPEMPDADFQAVQLLLTEAGARVDKLSQIDEKLSEELAKRLKELREAANGNSGKSETWQSFVQQLPGPFAVLDYAHTEATQISPRDYFWLDMGTSKLILIRDYVRLYESTTDEGRRAKLKQHEERFRKHLSLQSWDALRAAQSVMRQMQEGIFADDILQAMKEKLATIEMDPSGVKVNQQVRLSVWFHREELNRAEAHNEFVCLWNFGHHDLKEKGWVVSHFFPDAREYDNLSVTFEDADGRAIVGDGEAKIILKPERPIRAESEPAQWLGERTFTEMIRLAIPLIAALLGLIAGAKDQLLKLDLVPGLIAVFLVGFGADTIKNLLTRQNGQQ